LDIALSELPRSVAAGIEEKATTHPSGVNSESAELLGSLPALKAIRE